MERNWERDSLEKELERVKRKKRDRQSEKKMMIKNKKQKLEQSEQQKSEKQQEEFQELHSLLDLAAGVGCAICAEKWAVEIFKQRVGWMKSGKVDYEVEIPLCKECLDRFLSESGVLILCLKCGTTHLIDKRYGRLFYEDKNGREFKVIMLGSCKECEVGPANGVWFF